jgi:hypothetical protein
MATMKTGPTDADVSRFIESVPAAGRRRDAERLRELMEEVTGARAVMWGPSIVGFGDRPYTNTSGTHEWFAVGFSPRKAATTIYGILDRCPPDDPLFEQLGPHTTGKGCVYVRSLDDVDLDALRELIERTSGDDEGG